MDVVPGGRLDLGIGAGSRPGHPLARRQYEAHGLPFSDAGSAVESLGEACTVIRRLWTEHEPFDLSGTHVDLTGAFRNPSRSSVLTHRSSSAGAQPRGCTWSPSTPTWGTTPAATSTKPSAAAPPWIAFAEIGRHPDFITRSIVLPVAYGRPSDTRDAIGTATETRFEHIVLGLPAPTPPTSRGGSGRADHYVLGHIPAALK